MNKLDEKTRALILHLFVEGNSLRATARFADVSRNTVDKILREVGAACLDYQDKHLRNLSCKRVECDEIWSFVYSKKKNAPKDKQGEFGIGDVWTWTSIDPETKLVPCWHVANRDARSAHEFMNDLVSRLTHRVQLTTDGNGAYLNAVEDLFHGDIDYARLIKIYGQSPNGDKSTRYSPSTYTGSKIEHVQGSPERQHISTSMVERQNLTMRMSMRRFTCLTNAFSKKVSNHMHAISLHFMYYNFGRIHQTLKVTPAMEAGISDHIWSLEEIAGLAPIEAPKKHGKYKTSKNG